MIPFDTEEQAIEIANDTPYGLAAYLSTGSARGLQVAKKLRAGMVSINSASQDYDAPFGGYKQSGNGREWGVLADDFLKSKEDSLTVQVGVLPSVDSMFSGGAPSVAADATTFLYHSVTGY